MLSIRRNGNKAYVKGNKEDLLKLEKGLTFYMEGAEFSTLFQDGHWDGNVNFFQKRWGYFHFGLINKVRKLLQKRSIDYVIEGYEERGTKWVKFSEPFLAKERTYQRKAILEFLKQSFGIIKVPTRGGKTYIAAEIIRLLRGRENALQTLFVVDSVDLFEQAADDISLITGIPKEDIGKIQGDKFDVKPVTIAMIQTITSALYPTKKNPKTSARKRDFNKLLKSIDFMIVDEIQEFGSSKKRLAALKKVDAEWWLSLSATPFKDNNEIQEYNIESFTGGIVYEIEEKELRDNKVLADNKILLLPFEHDPSYSASYGDVFNELVVENRRRNRVLIDVLDTCEELGLKTVAIFRSVEHIKIISKQTGYGSLHGEDPTEKRNKVKERFLRNSGGVLLVSDIWKKGITLPSVDVLFNVDGGKESTLVLQRRGRVLGTSDNKKKALYIDFTDFADKFLSDHSLSRIEAYEGQLEGKYIEALDTDGDIRADLKSYLIEWFELNVPE